jgi:hypothetical protein
VAQEIAAAANTEVPVLMDGGSGTGCDRLIMLALGRRHAWWGAIRYVRSATAQRCIHMSYLQDTLAKGVLMTAGPDRSRGVRRIARISEFKLS